MNMQQKKLYFFYLFMLKYLEMSTKHPIFVLTTTTKKHLFKLKILSIMENTIFETGNIYGMKFIGDSNLVVSWICVKRTAKTVTFERFQNPSESMKRRIKVYEGVEYVLEGNYSMAPSIRANNIIG